MMISKTLTFECITPCFCAGIPQSQAEIRPSAIRGALRWWFRCFGGTIEQENLVFGGANPVRSSALLVRVSNVSSKPVGRLPEIRPNDPLSYILYFPSVASDKSRWNPAACLGCGTRFDLHLRQLRSLPIDCLNLFESSLVAFRHHGAIGMHVTRGLGAVQDIDSSSDSFDKADEILRGAGFTIRRSNRPHKIWDSVLKEAGQWLKYDLRKEFGAGGNKKPRQATALGNASPRQTSAIHLRPVRIENSLFLSAFEAPHSLVLGPASRARHSQPVLTSRDFTQPPPSF